MFSSDQIWDAMDRLALCNGLSASRLAIVAGLDATTLNKSKRTGADGRPRWPSTETIAMILSATRTTPQDFFDIVCGTRPSRRRRTTAKGHILLVDPDPLFSDRMASGLDAVGYDVELAPDLRHALGVVESGSPLDLLITDFHLPHGAHGRALARIALSYHPHLQTIFVTHTVFPASVAIGTETILQKPLGAARLGEVVAELLGAAQAAPAEPSPHYSGVPKANGALSGSS